MNHVYGIKASRQQVKDAIYAARKAYSELPETTCSHKTCCCRAGCPNMYYAEFLSIYRGAVEKLSKAQRLDLIIECVRQYLAPQQVDKPKPCVFLSGNDCAVYEFRPLKCRLYGLIPSSLYEWIVDSVAKDMKTPKEQLPLCTQCDQVKVKDKFKAKFPDGVVPEDKIKKLEIRLRLNDSDLGMPEHLQHDGYGFLTYHDWHIMFDLGEKWMTSLSTLRTKAGEEEKEHFIQALRDALQQRDEIEE